MQELWVSGIVWDDQLTEYILDNVQKWFAELQDLDNIKIGRCLRRPLTQVITDQSFHVFSDRSENAYAAVMYELNAYEDESVSVAFITSKSKVAALNAHSIPRLDRLGAIQRLLLYQVVLKVLGDHVLKKSVSWCESLNVLYWVRIQAESSNFLQLIKLVKFSGTLLMGE